MPEGNGEAPGQDNQFTGHSTDAGISKETCPGDGIPAGETDPCREIRTQLSELQERYIRLAADCDNLRKRTERDRQAIIRFANEEFAVALLEVVDSLDRALQAEKGAITEGFVQIRKLFLDILARQGVLPVEAKGVLFNPVEHDAIAMLPSDLPEGIIVEEICRGYRMHDKIIRCAKVTVSRGNNGSE